MTRAALIATFLVAVLTISGLWANSDKAGTNGFNFLNINYCPRAAALAGAYTGLSDDAEGVFFNPAGLRQIEQLEVTASYMSYIEDLQGGSVVVAFPRTEKIKLAAFSQFMTTPEIDKTVVDEMGNYSNQGTFTTSDLLFGVAAGYEYSPVLDIGGAVKYLHEGLDDCTASALAIDLSIQHQTTYNFLRVGVALRNIGIQTSYFTDAQYKEKMPTTAVVGFSYHPLEILYTNCDIYKPLNDDFSGRFGVEYRVHPRMDLRLGYNTDSSDWRTGGDMEWLSGITAGFGVNWKTYKLDYAMSSYGDLGMINQVSIHYLLQ